MAELARHLAYLEEAYEAAAAAPLSVRKAMLVAMLADAYADRLFGAQGQVGDITIFRAGLATRSPALAAVFEIGSGRARLTLEAVEVPEYSTLSVEDFMISVYNGQTVQRVRVVHADGRRDDALPLLADAVRALAAASGV